MNINDVDDSKVPEVIELKWFFDQQEELLRKYIPIEVGHIATTDCPVNIDSQEGQIRLKEEMWRVTEELMEAYEEFMKYGNTEHFKEELIDGLHFLLELLILAGIHSAIIERYLEGQNFKDAYNDIPKYGELNSWYIHKPIYFLGMSGNCLKQKPWKQTHQLTDKDKLANNLFWAFETYLMCCHHFEITPDMLFQLYFKKNAVNQFRIRSKY